MRHSAVLDIGSSKVICMVVSSEPDGAIVVHGIGSRQYDGYRFSSLPGVRSLREAVEGALRRAERESHTRIKEVCVGIPSPFLSVFAEESEVSVTSKNGRVSVSDIDMLLEDSLEFEQPSGFSLIHSTPIEYRIDGSPVIGSPIGLPAAKLAAEVSHCYIDDRFRNVVIEALYDIGVSVHSFVSSALATACFIIPEEQRLRGSVLVDCGGSHTDVTLLCGNAILALDSIGIGGNHITSDLRYGLRLPDSVAEDIKRRYVFSLDYGDSVERIRVPGEGIFEVEHSLIQLIVESRAEELCEHIGASLPISCAPEAPVWLVGGGLALIRGSQEFLARCIGRNVEATMPWMSAHSSVNYAAAFGLADFTLFRLGSSNGVKSFQSARKNAFMRSIKEIFNN